MCGIAGIVNHEGQIAEPQLAQMCTAISHRGPDDFGVQVWLDQGVGLGHRRLSIIDLSPAGRNPMSNEDGTVWITFNGEIYNFQSLRRELEAAGHIFRSNADTEVIIHAYEEWGDSHVTRLRGMFSYAIYDRRTESTATHSHFRLFVARDRLGIKPLFYYWHSHQFLFASEIKSLLANPTVDRAPDHSALFDFLTYWYIPTPKTAYAHIRKLPPGHYLVFESGDCRVQQYWDVALDCPSPVRTEQEAVDLVRTALAEAVSLHMISDVPVGVFLSGGLDSSTVTALMAKTASEPIRSFSIGFDVEAHSETQYARIVAEHFHTRHYERIVGADSVQQMLPFVLSMYDEPYADGSAVPTYRVSAVAAEQVKVVLSGDGGDEVFAGYNWYSRWMRRRKLDWIPLNMRRTLLPHVSNLFSQQSRTHAVLADLARSPLEQYAHLLEMLSPSAKRRLLAPEWQREFADYDDYWFFRQYWREETDHLTRVQYLDLKTYLPDDILTKVDRASMAVSLEVRPPLLDHVVVETLFSIPHNLRFPDGQKKHLLREVARDLLPDAILARRKKGFSAPWSHWMQAEGKWVEQMLQDAISPMFINEWQQAVPPIFANGAQIWSVLLLTQWWSNEMGMQR